MEGTKRLPAPGVDLRATRHIVRRVTEARPRF